VQFQKISILLLHRRDWNFLGMVEIGGGGVCETKQIKEMQIRIFTELYNVMFLVSAGADL